MPTAIFYLLLLLLPQVLVANDKAADDGGGVGQTQHRVGRNRTAPLTAL